MAQYYTTAGSAPAAVEMNNGGGYVGAAPTVVPSQQSMMDYGRLHTAFADDNTARLRYVGYATDKPWDCRNCMCGCCTPCKVSQDELKKNHFVAVYDNRVVYSEPDCACYLESFQRKAILDCAFCDIRGLLNCCNGRILIRNTVSVIYLDRAVAQNAAVPGCCSPFCTHGELCPNGCGYCGEAVILYERTRPCCKCSCLGCSPLCNCCTWTVVNQLDGHEDSPLQSVMDTCNPCTALCACTRHKMIRHLDNGARLAQEINQARAEYNRARTGPIITGLTRQEAEDLEREGGFCC